MMQLTITPTGSERCGPTRWVLRIERGRFWWVSTPLFWRIYIGGLVLLAATDPLPDPPRWASWASMAIVLGWWWFFAALNHAGERRRARKAGLLRIKILSNRTGHGRTRAG